MYFMKPKIYLLIICLTQRNYSKSIYGLYENYHPFSYYLFTLSFYNKILFKIIIFLFKRKYYK